MGVGIKVKGMRDTEREIRKLQRRLGIGAGEFADLAASVVSKTVARNAQPFGVGKKAFEKGKGAVLKDLHKIFQLVPEGARGRAGVVSSVAAAKRWHDQRRTSRGSVKRGEKKKILPSVFRMYAAEVQKRVGMAKGSVIGGGDSRLKGRFSKWFSRWAGAGDAKRRGSIGGAVWEFSSEVAHVANSRVLGARGVVRVMRAKDRNLRTVLRARMKRELKRANRRLG